MRSSFAQRPSGFLVADLAHRTASFSTKRLPTSLRTPCKMTSGDCRDFGSSFTALLLVDASFAACTSGFASFVPIVKGPASRGQHNNISRSEGKVMHRALEHIHDM